MLSGIVYALASWFGNRSLEREIERRKRLPRAQQLWHNYYGWGRDYDVSLPYPPK